MNALAAGLHLIALAWCRLHLRYIDPAHADALPWQRAAAEHRWRLQQYLGGVAT